MPGIINQPLGARCGIVADLDGWHSWHTDIANLSWSRLELQPRLGADNLMNLRRIAEGARVGVARNYIYCMGWACWVISDCSSNVPHSGCLSEISSNKRLSEHEIRTLMNFKDDFACLCNINCYSSSILKQSAGWWFGTYFIFPSIGNNHHPNGLIFFRGFATNNQISTKIQRNHSRNLHMRSPSLTADHCRFQGCT